MKIEIETSIKNIEAANCLLGLAIQAFKESPANMKRLNISKTNVKDAEQFRKSLLKAFI